MDIGPASIMPELTDASPRPSPMLACPHLEILKRAVTDDCSADELATLLQEKYNALAYLLNARPVPDEWIDLQRTDLSGMDLEGIRLCRVDFQFARLLQVCFNDAHIDNVNFSHANLTGATFLSADFCGVTFEMAACNNVDFFDSTLGGAWFDGANLAGARLSCGIYLDAIEIASIKLLRESDALPPEDEAIRLIIPDVWTRDSLDIYLNHFNNEVSGSLLSTINSMDARYDDKKVELVCALATSLTQQEVDLSAVAEPILSSLHTTPYIANQMLSAWLHEVTLQLLKKYNAQRMPRPIEPLVDALLACFQREPASMNHYNMAFIQFIWWKLGVLRREPAPVAAESLSVPAMPEPSSSFPPARAQGKCALVNRLSDRYLKIRWLYEQYLSHPAVHPYTLLSDFGDYAHQADFSSEQAFNYVLFSAREHGPVMLLSGASLGQWLATEISPAATRDHFFLYQGMMNLSLNGIDLEKLYEEHFPLFFGIYASLKNTGMFEQLLDEFAFDVPMATCFRQAIRQRSMDITLTTPAGSDKLMRALMPALHGMEPPFFLNEQHYQRIVDIYALHAAAAERQALTLMILAAIFTRYASASFFGSERDSPLPLRWYAHALMIKSESLAPSLFADVLTDWKNRQLGSADAFSCAALLAQMMIEYLQQRFPTELNRVLPLAWH
jgi:hypothetical protein